MAQRHLGGIVDLKDISYGEENKRWEFKKWQEVVNYFNHEILFVQSTYENCEILDGVYSFELNFRDACALMNFCDYYLGWEEMINKYRKFFPEIENIMPAPMFGHKVWETQIKKLNNAYTVSYDSFKTHKFYLDSKTRDERIATLKDIELIENTNIKKPFINEMQGKIPFKEKKKIKFNTIEKFYFFIRRKLESRKNRKNY